MQRFYFLALLLCVSSFLVGQDCETFASSLDQIKRDIIDSPEKPIADVDFLYTFDGKIVKEPTLRGKCVEDIELAEVIYRRIEGHTDFQPWLRFETKKPASTITPNNDDVVFIINWELPTKEAEKLFVSDHPLYHDQVINGNRVEVLFRLDQKILESDINPDHIKSVMVYKNALDLERFSAGDSEGVVEIVLKSKEDYMKALKFN